MVLSCAGSVVYLSDCSLSNFVVSESVLFNVVFVLFLFFYCFFFFFCFFFVFLLLFFFFFFFFVLFCFFSSCSFLFCFNFFFHFITLHLCWVTVRLPCLIPNLHPENSTGH